MFRREDGIFVREDLHEDPFFLLNQSAMIDSLVLIVMLFRLR